MILIFGGTTEGLLVAKLLNILNEPYIYHTKTSTSQKVEGKHLHGTLTAEGIVNFCRQQSVKLIIDAGHPFAQELHRNVAKASVISRIASIRFERKFPKIDEALVKRFDSFEMLSEHLNSLSPMPILALTGVQTIKYFPSLWDKMPMHFRILNTELSMQSALKTGISQEFIHPSPAHITEESMLHLIEKTNPKIIITKESGESGYFNLKQKIAKECGIKLWVVTKPEMPEYSHTVDEIRDLHQLLLKFRKEVWKDENNLKSGYTSGTCITAAAKAAFEALLTGRFPTDVEIVIPSGKTIKLATYSDGLSENRASCLVVKDAGDDPDVTHAALMGCNVELTEEPGISFDKGIGVGVVTLPGLKVSPGEPAINETPRQMIRKVIEELSLFYDYHGGVIITPFVPCGEELAQKTFNPRVGVVGGISIIGTSGEVKPLSHSAFINAIEQQIKVVAAMGIDEVVSTAGLRSEKVIKKRFSHLPQQAFIHHGNFIGDTVKLAIKNGINKITIGIMPGKAIKLAEGHLNTHSAVSSFNASFAAQLAKDCGYNDVIVEKISQLTLANAIQEFIPFGEDEVFYKTIGNLACSKLSQVIPNNNDVKIILIKW
ncbi:cobalt-precorrin-5B (C(1))-methyltransferase CbiD [Alkalitalea saponilacus]|uniref:Cobalt-precorrin-5B C(1)-methyltransferase n=1 Tax=Alkalitalea saponilacus TaxID=889453 RepID=A0A1T5GMU0_9BACT|nr:cobalt-precorrin-5B (C(1))-methyltransferase CbiD [Alkalitalea saponilacus]ASB48261.1 precorrin-6x reductase [Alkalitalea saponilacus]SKC09729.1 cobalt-precorrin-5B (C1)-methyltransferase [Alkalitalea saponilacus]